MVFQGFAVNSDALKHQLCLLECERIAFNGITIIGMLYYELLTQSLRLSRCEGAKLCETEY